MDAVVFLYPAQNSQEMLAYVACQDPKSSVNCVNNG
jgi:CRISPR/Cas system CMR subunit Cmr4 (Cas7 group RAMP superfamily)